LAVPLECKLIDEIDFIIVIFKISSFVIQFFNPFFQATPSAVFLKRIKISSYLVMQLEYHNDIYQIVLFP
jgi:hypothetical protein